MKTRLTCAGLMALSIGLGTAPAVLAQDDAQAASDVKSVYVIELKGKFGSDISQTPIRDAVKDAKRLEPDYLVVVMDNDWTRDEGLEKLGDDVAGAFDQLFRAEDMDPIFTREIPHEWDKQPQVIFWVKKAMGGAAFLPLICSDIYFHPDGRLGGVGYIEEMLKGGGDEVVVQKQLSLRLGHAEGMALMGGHEPKLINAMCLTSYVLSVRFEGDEPEYLERMPENDAEYLLTDDGKDANVDSFAERSRGKSNDILTLDAQWAQKLKLSKGTVASMDDLMFALGISRNHEILKGRSESILENWRDGVASYRRDIETELKEFERIMVQGDTPRKRNQLRGQKISRLQAAQKIMKKYAEAINPRQFGFPDYEDLNIMIEQLRMEIRRDK
jgi:hypothetical protein